jgi:hypothetical protein
VSASIIIPFDTHASLSLSSEGLTAVSHRAEISKLLDFQDTLVGRMRKEMEAVVEPIKPAETAAEGSEFEDDDEDEPAEEQEPSILHVLNKD